MSLLPPDGQVFRAAHDVSVSIAAHAGEMTEIVVERPVLLHQNNDMLNILDRSAFASRRNGAGTLDRRKQPGQREAGARGQKSSAFDV